MNKQAASPDFATWQRESLEQFAREAYEALCIMRASNITLGPVSRFFGEPFFQPLPDPGDRAKKMGSVNDEAKFLAPLAEQLRAMAMGMVMAGVTKAGVEERPMEAWILMAGHVQSYMQARGISMVCAH